MSRANFAKLALTLIMMLMLTFSTTAFCTDLDTINGTQVQQQNGSEDGTTEIDEAYDSITDVMRGYNAVDQESMQKASKLASPIADIIGILTGVVISLTTALIFLVTALDIMYISVPFTRKFLNPEMAQGGAQGGMGMGMRGGMGMGMQGAQGGGGGHRWVSDEAVQALQASGMAQGGAQGAMGGGMGMGGYGGMNAMGAQQEQSGTKSTIFAYLKKRMFFLIVFAITSTILLSSILLDCGLNLADLLYKIISLFSDGISNVQI